MKSSSASTETIAPTTAPTHHEIAECARELWTQAGRPEGRDAPIWLEAENRLRDARRVPAATDVTSTPPVSATAKAVSAKKNVPIATGPREPVAPTPSGRPPSSAELAGAHQRTYHTIFQHPVSHNLQWRDVHALFRQLGEVVEKANGSLLVTRHGQTLVLPAPRTKDVSETEEVIKIRHFLERTESPLAESATSTARCLVIINHHEVRIFHTVTSGTASKQILPHDPADYFRQAPQAKAFARGREKPEANSFFAPVAKALEAAHQILIFGSGTGTSNEMDQFVAWLHTHQPELARRIVGSLVVDEHHLTDGQLLAKARDFYATPQSPQIAPR